MDLRIDYAFKLLFSKGDPRLLISLLNAIFANKRIKRIIKSITIKNPFLDKESNDDKLSILDIRAELDNGTNVLIEMHLYGLTELKAKTIRSWARVFAEELEVGDRYSDQTPTIIIAFADGQVEPIENVENANTKTANTSKDKIHRLCMIMDKEDFTVFTDAMELHYIDMKAFAKGVNETGSINIDDTIEAMFAKWLSIITQKEITNKAIIENACKDKEELQMAVSTLARQSEDKIARQAYQRRQDEIYYYNKEKYEYESRLEQERRRAEEERRRAEEAESVLAEKDAAIAGKDIENEQLRQQIAELRSQLDTRPTPH
jgi:predicted transposase/invertase (TIGR01784 family)